jgi:hypothetical protein
MMSIEKLRGDGANHLNMYFNNQKVITIKKLRGDGANHLNMYLNNLSS